MARYAGRYNNSEPIIIMELLQKCDPEANLKARKKWYKITLTSQEYCRPIASQQPPLLERFEEEVPSPLSAAFSCFIREHGLVLPLVQGDGLRYNEGGHPLGRADQAPEGCRAGEFCRW